MDILVGQRALPTLRRQEREQALLKEASAQLKSLRQWLDDGSTGHKERSPVVNWEADQGTSKTRRGGVAVPKVEDWPWKRKEAAPSTPITTLADPASPTHLLQEPPLPSAAPQHTGPSILPQPAPEGQTRRPLPSQDPPLPELTNQDPGLTQAALSLPLPMAGQGSYTQAFIKCNQKANNSIMKLPPHLEEPKERGERRQTEATRPPNQVPKAAHSPDPAHKIG